MTLPKRAYLICANQRSGSTMLCRALADTGIAGRPEEYFLSVDPVQMPGWKEWEGGPFAEPGTATSRERYLETVYRLGSTPNEIFGAKLMWNNVAWAVRKFQAMKEFSTLNRAEVFHRAFPDLHCVLLTRRDHLRQAVSWARVTQDGLRVEYVGEPTPPPGPADYNFDFISNLERLIREGEKGWRELFKELQLAPYEVVYEDLVTDDGYEQPCEGSFGILE